MISERAAILPYPGDPFLFNYWLKYFDKYWADEVGKLYVYLNSTIESEVVDYIRELCIRRPKVNFTYNPQQIEHGDALNRTLDIVTEKYVMLIEDDAFIFKRGAVDSAFAFLESGQFDIVGSKRGSCSQIILDKAAEKWGIRYDGIGDQGCNFWPNYFFSTRDLLLSTDRNFGARAWDTGDTIAALGYVVEAGPVVGDTFVNTSLQLHAIIPESRIKYLPQYHAHPEDLTHFEHGHYLFDGVAPWTHIGSLSSGVGGLIRDNDNRPLSRRTCAAPNGPVSLENAPTSDFERHEYERRVQWWLKFWENREEGKIEEFAGLYYTALMTIITQFGLSIKEIRKRQRAYATIGL